MKSLSSRMRTATLAVAVVAAGILGAPTSSRAQGAIDADARSVLDAMSTYLGGLRNFSVAYAAVDEVVTTEGQKLQFLHAGELMVQHPDRLHALQQLYMVEAGGRSGRGRRRCPPAATASSSNGVGRGGVGTLSVNGRSVAERRMERSIPFYMQWDEPFDVGQDTRTPVDDCDYQVPFAFTGTFRSMQFNLGASTLPQSAGADLQSRIDIKTPA